ncbi:hypothetical protein M3Y97_00739600 [Aphelenchoides bicaudatus]|nr:hypothetical protein M3Y97_00739600 [Aphelenchoides bicaudatus]
MSLNRPGAWSRQAPQNQQLNPNLFTGQLNLAQPFAAGQPINLAPGIGALVNQAAFSNVNNAALAAAQRQLIPQRAASPARGGAQNTPNQRTFVGQVTKLMENYGFIDEDVFFQTSVIRGPMPRVGDRVMVEATFNPSMPFKWNAFRIQPINEMNQPVQQHQPQSRQANPPSSNRWGDREGRDDIRNEGPRGNSYERNRPQRRSPPPRRDARRSPQRRFSPPQRRQSPRREASKRERERSPIRESRETRRSPAQPAKRDDSPPRRRQRIIPRYQAYIPRSPVSDFLNYTELHKRYTSLYIPSDFVRCDLSWKNSFNLENPIEFSSNAVNFHVLHKDVDYPFNETNPLPVELPDDADTRYIVKVLLPAHPGAIELRKRVTGLLPDGSLDEALDVQNLNRVLHFVIGCRGKGEVMGIGGAYSPSLDGENPLDMHTLIKTAIRTTKAMTAIDLSKCSTWYKMLHLRYYRVDRERWDHVVLLLPDTGSIPSFLSTADDYQKLVQEILPEQLKQKISQIDTEPFAPQSDAAKKVQSALDNETTESADDEKNKEDAAADTSSAEVAKTTDQADTSLNQSTEAANNSEVQYKTFNEANGTASSQSNKIHWSELHVKNLKVEELRKQLSARGLETKGLKNVLAERLQEAVDAEKASEEAGNAQEEVKPEPVKPESNDDVVMIDEVKASDIDPNDLVVTDEVDEKMETDEAKTEEASEEKPAEQPKVEKKPAYSKEEKEEHKREVDRFEKSKKERKSALERHYTFPKEPCVFVYPNKTAKAGKFDCRSVSIQSLLDYRLDDNKESSFEAFLFAEAYHEAIDRAQAFNVYHTLNGVLDKDAERKRREEALTKVEEPMETEETKATEEEKPAENGVEVNGEQTEEKPVEGAEQTDEKSSEDKEKPAEEAEKKDEKADKKKSDIKEVDPRLNFKALVNDVDTFMAFCHFDQNICGYLTDRDMEEILHSIGLNLSRATVQRLIRKVSSRDRFNYRNITDKWVDKDFNLKYAPEFPDAPTRAQLLKVGEKEFETTNGSAADTGSTPDVSQTGVVFYKGAVLNIDQSQEQHKLVSSEKDAALLKIQELESILKITKDQRDTTDKKLNEVLELLAQNKKKLQEAVEVFVASKKKIQEATDIVNGVVADSNHTA